MPLLLINEVCVFVVLFWFRSWVLVGVVASRCFFPWTTVLCSDAVVVVFAGLFTVVFRLPYCRFVIFILALWLLFHGRGQ